MIRDKVKLITTSFIMMAISCVCVAGLTACGGSGSSTGAAGKAGQDDARYSERTFEQPTTKDAYDGKEITLPEGYVTAYDTQKKENEVHEYKVDETISINGAKYIVHQPSKVHASNSIEGFDSFLVDLEIKGDEEHPTGDAAGCGYFVYSPSGLYASDLQEMKRIQDLDDKRREYEEKGEQVPEDFYDQYYSSKEEFSWTKTFEIPYEGDGIYTVEIRDFTNSQVYRVPMEIKLNS